MPESHTNTTQDGLSENSSENRPDFRNFEDILRRLLLASGASSETELSRVLGIKQPSITGARKRGVIPAGWIIAIAQRYGVSADWLLFGYGPTHRSRMPSRQETLALFGHTPESLASAFRAAAQTDAKPSSVASNDPEIMLIPKVKARLSAGGGSLETNDDVVGLYAFRAQFLRRKGNAKEMVLMDVSGDSMEPDIKSGDTVLIDQSQTEIIAGSIYAVGMDEEVVIKVLEKAPGKIILRSYNTLFPPFEIDIRGDLSDGVRIIGRVIWWCREAR